MPSIQSIAQKQLKDLKEQRAELYIEQFHSAIYGDETLIDDQFRQLDYEIRNLEEIIKREKEKSA